MSERTLFVVALLAGVALGGAGVATMTGAEAPVAVAAIERGDPIGAPDASDIEELAAKVETVDPFEALTQIPPDELRPDQRLPGDPKASPPDRIMKPEEWDKTPENMRGTQDEVKPRREQLGDGTISVNFAYLASFTFRYDGPEKHRIPEKLTALGGKSVQVEGFMIPTMVRQGRVAQFVLVRHILNCCFGQPPKITEVIRVDLPAGEEVPRLDGTVIVRGPLQVGVERDERGEVCAIYRMKAKMVSAIR